MFLRISSTLGLLAVLTACGSAETESEDGSAGPAAGSNAAEQASVIDCAVGEGSGMGPDCTVETSQVDGDTILTISNPDGGFRRFRILPDGAGLESLTGADEAEQTLDGDVLEIAVGGDRYRLPAAPKAPAASDGDSL